MGYFLLEKLGTRTTSDVRNLGFWNISIVFVLNWLSIPYQKISGAPPKSLQVFIRVLHNTLVWRSDSQAGLPKTKQQQSKRCILFGFGCGQCPQRSMGEKHSLMSEDGPIEEFRSLGLCL